MSRRSSPSCSDGFTLVELLVALTVAGVIAGATLSIALSSHRLYESDQYRTTVNQNLRAGLDIIGIDVRQAGERLPGDLPAIEIDDGASGAPDVLHLRRNLLDNVLPVCMDVNGGSAADAVFVAKHGLGSIPPGCGIVPDLDDDGWPDNLQEWREYRLAHGGEVLAYIYNPTLQAGEFFTYDDEDSSNFHIHKANAATELWENDYNTVDNSRVYIMEQLAFQLDGEVLQSVVNGDTTAPLNLVSSIIDFQARAWLNDGSSLDDLGPADHWNQLRSIEVTLSAAETFRDRTLTRTVTTEFFPRNVLSLPPTLGGVGTGG